MRAYLQPHSSPRKKSLGAFRKAHIFSEITGNFESNQSWGQHLDMRQWISCSAWYHHPLMVKHSNIWTHVGHSYSNHYRRDVIPYHQWKGSNVLISCSLPNVISAKIYSHTPSTCKINTISHPMECHGHQIQWTNCLWCPFTCSPGTHFSQLFLFLWWPSCLQMHCFLI